MRRSFPGGSGMGGGGGHGGGMLKTLGRVARAGVNGLQTDPFSLTQNNSSARPSTTTANKSNTSRRGLSFSSSTTASPTAATTWGFNSSPFSTDEFDWEYVDEDVCEKASGFSDDCVFGSPPSIHEVEEALYSLQQVFQPVFVRDKIPSNLENNVLERDVSSAAIQRTNSEVDWTEPSMQPYEWRRLQTHGSNMVYDAFHLLQTESSVQRMVVSLSSDKAVWDAVLNNDVVREIKESFEKDSAEENGSRSSEENPDSSALKAAAGVLRWIFENMKLKFTEAITNVTKLVTDLFQRPDDEKKESSDIFTEKLKTSFMVTVVVMLVVVVARAHRA